MNNRFKELAKEAGYYLYDLTETHECKTVETDSKDEWITLEKFAELIVAECIKLCEHNSNDDEYDQYDMGQSVKAENIKASIMKEFGVEE